MQAEHPDKIYAWTPDDRYDLGTFGWSSRPHYGGDLFLRATPERRHAEALMQAIRNAYAVLPPSGGRDILKRAIDLVDGTE